MSTPLVMMGPDQVAYAAAVARDRRGELFRPLAAAPAEIRSYTNAVHAYVLEPHGQVPVRFSRAADSFCRLRPCDVAGEARIELARLTNAAPELLFAIGRDARGMTVIGIDGPQGFIHDPYLLSVYDSPEGPAGYRVGRRLRHLLAETNGWLGAVAGGGDGPVETEVAAAG